MKKKLMIGELNNKRLHDKVTIWRGDYMVRELHDKKTMQ